MRLKDTIDYIGLWETLNNPNFNRVEFDTFKKEYGRNFFVMTPSKWIKSTNAIRIKSKAGKYGKGKTKASKLYSVKEFGYKCLLYSLYEVLNYGEILNIPQADENERIMERKEILLFNYDVYREAVINAFLHNEWINLNEPMITFYSDRIEILSRGTLSPLQTLEGFYKGHSIPINDKLSELFLQLHISEKTGRGILKIISVYGKESIEVNDNNLTVTIPFNRINENTKVGNKEGNKVGNKNLNNSQIKVLAEIRNNPNVTKQQLTNLCELGKTSIDNIISTLKKLGYIERIGSNKTGYWKVNE